MDSRLASTESETAVNMALLLPWILLFPVSRSSDLRLEIFNFLAASLLNRQSKPFCDSSLDFPGFDFWWVLPLLPTLCLVAQKTVRNSCNFFKFVVSSSDTIIGLYSIAFVLFLYILVKLPGFEVFELICCRVFVIVSRKERSMRIFINATK